MFNTFALSLRPDEIRLFIVFFGAVVSAALAAVARWLRSRQADALVRGRQGVLSPLGRVLAGAIAVDVAAGTVMEAARLKCSWIVDGAGRLMCRWTLRRPLTPPH